MGCINKSDKKYKKLEERYGDFLADVHIRSHPKNRFREADENFYIPNLNEVNKKVKSEVPRQALNKLEIALKQNPSLSEKGIASYLIGIINKSDDEVSYLVSRGRSDGILQRTISDTEVYGPNLELMEFLTKKYPELFSIEETRNNLTKKVLITPREKITEKVDENPGTIPSIQSSLDSFKSLTDLNGVRPLVFQAGPHRWEQVTGSIYNLVDKTTGNIFYRNVNLISGQQEELPQTPIDTEKANMLISEIESLASSDYFQELLGLNGYSVEEVLNNLRNAETQEQFAIEYAKITKIYC